MTQRGQNPLFSQTKQDNMETLTIALAKIIGYLIYLMVKSSYAFKRIFGRRTMVPRLPEGRRKLQQTKTRDIDSTSYDLAKVLGRVTKYEKMQSKCDCWWLDIFLCRAAGFGVGLYVQDGIADCQDVSMLKTGIRELIAHLHFKRAGIPLYRSYSEKVVDCLVNEWIHVLEKALDSPIELKEIQRAMLRSGEGGLSVHMERVADVHARWKTYGNNLRIMASLQYGGDEIVEMLSGKKSSKAAYALFAMLIYGSRFGQLEPELSSNDLLPRNRIVADEASWHPVRAAMSSETRIRNDLAASGCVLPEDEKDRDRILRYLESAEASTVEEERVAFLRNGHEHEHWMCLMACGYYKVDTRNNKACYAKLFKSHPGSVCYGHAPKSLPLSALKKFKKQADCKVRCIQEGPGLYHLERDGDCSIEDLEDGLYGEKIERRVERLLKKN